MVVVVVVGWAAVMVLFVGWRLLFCFYCFFCSVSINYRDSTVGRKLVKIYVDGGFSGFRDTIDPFSFRDFFIIKYILCKGTTYV